MLDIGRRIAGGLSERLDAFLDMFIGDLFGEEPLNPVINGINKREKSLKDEAGRLTFIGFSEGITEVFVEKNISNWPNKNLRRVVIEKYPTTRVRLIAQDIDLSTEESYAKGVLDLRKIFIEAAGLEDKAEIVDLVLERHSCPQEPQP